MRRAWIGGWACASVMMTLHAIAFAQAPQWKPQFVQPEPGTAGQTAPLRIHVVGIPEDTPERLGVELDNIDVTALAVLDGTDIVVTPAQPISFGAHVLRLVESARDGSIVERGQWAFEIRKSAVFREAHLQANAMLNATQRIAEHNANAGRQQANGSAQVQGAVANDDWQAKGAASIVANSQSDQMPRHDGHLDIGQYLIEAQRGAVSGRIGDQGAMAPDNLVMQGFARRGVSADVVAGGVARFTGFSMHATPVAGSSNLTGVQDRQDRVDGVVATLSPVQGRPEVLALSGTYVDGNGTSASGAGVAGSPQSFGGHAGSVAADARLLDQLLRLRGEYARSGYDFDGTGGTLEQQSGHAYSALANYLPWHQLMVLGQPLVWNVGAQKQLLSTFFHSPANPGAVADRDMRQAFTGVNWYGLNAQASAGKEHDNVDDLALLPRTESTQHSFALNYVPILSAAPTPGTPPPVPFYGQPNLTASYMTLKKELANNPGALPLPLGPLHETTNLMLGAQFQYARWNWGLGHTRVADKDFANLTPETRTNSERVQAGVQLAKLLVGGSLQYDHADDLTNDTRTQAVTAATTLAYPFTERVTSNVAYSVRHARAVPQSDQLASDTTIALNWVVVPPRAQRPGFSLGLDGSYHACHEKLASSAPEAACFNSFQAFLRLSLSWMPTY
jgi:hypothetical protein